MERSSSLILGVCTIIIICALVVAFFVVFVQPSDEDLSYDHLAQIAVTKSATSDISSQTLKLFMDIVSVAEKQKDLPESSSLISETLMDLYVTQPSSTSLYRTNAEGTVIAAVPNRVKDRVGDEWGILESDYDITQNIHMVPYHRESLGRTDIVILSPVLTKSGEFDGYVVFVIDPEVFLGPVLTQYRNAGYDVWILSDDDVLIYHPDKPLIGLNIYDVAKRDGSGLSAVLPEIIENPSGITEPYASYSYGKLKNIVVGSTWDTMTTLSGNMKIIVSKELAEEWRVPRPSVSTDQTLEQFVQAAYLHANMYGMEEAIKTFSDHKSFVTKEYYISAVATNGTVLANPFRPGDTGQQRITDSDSNGVATIESMITRAEQGGGYVIGVNPNPAKNLTEELKLSYVLPVNDEWFVTAGKYLPDSKVHANLSLKNEMISYARSIQQYNQLAGSEATIEALNTENGQFYRDNIALLGVDYTGKIIARPNDPKDIGSSIMGMTDIYGSSFGRTTVTLANSGGGLHYVYMPDATTGKSTMMLEYVLPVNDEWFVAASIPLDT